MNKKTQRQINEALEEIYYIESIKVDISKGKIEGYLEAKENDMVDEIVNGLCGTSRTKDFRTNIIMAAYHANLLAHNIDETFYSIKSYLLEYVFKEKLWGEEPYDCYGIGYDNFGNDVAYFDVPECGQVSFHLVATEYDSDVPEYKYKWSGTRNNQFPSYSCIENMHNLLMALGYKNNYTQRDETASLYPINFSEIKNDETRNTCYFTGLNEFYEKLEKGPIEDISIIDRIQIKKIVFTKKEGIIEERDVSDRNEKIRLLKKYHNFDSIVSNALQTAGIIEIEEDEIEK